MIKSKVDCYGVISIWKDRFVPNRKNITCGHFLNDIIPEEEHLDNNASQKSFLSSVSNKFPLFSTQRSSISQSLEPDFRIPTPNGKVGVCVSFNLNSITSVNVSKKKVKLILQIFVDILSFVEFIWNDNGVNKIRSISTDDMELYLKKTLKFKGKSINPSRNKRTVLGFRIFVLQKHVKSCLLKLTNLVKSNYLSKKLTAVFNEDLINEKSKLAKKVVNALSMKFYLKEKEKQFISSLQNKQFLEITEKLFNNEYLSKTDRKTLDLSFKIKRKELAALHKLTV